MAGTSIKWNNEISYAHKFLTKYFDLFSFFEFKPEKYDGWRKNYLSS